MASTTLRLKGVRVHNLQNIDVELPKRRLAVLTGPSGSGKSSLAFDTIYAEGQRRYIESMSVYARQFLGQLQRPDLDELEGLSPTVAVEQKAVATNPRSTVGTVTEVHDHLRILYARIGVPWCPACDIPVEASHPDAIVREVLAYPPGTRIQILAPLVRNRKGEFRELFVDLRRRKLVHVRVDGAWIEADTIDRLKKTVRHTIDVVVDRLRIGRSPEARVTDAVRTALELGEGQLLIMEDDGSEAPREVLRSMHAQCTSCGMALPPLTHQSFSFNSPIGRCPDCEGLGTELAIDPERVVVAPELSIADGAIPWLVRSSSKQHRREKKVVEAWCKAAEIPRRKPWKELTSEERDLVLHGDPQAHRTRLAGYKNEVILRWPGVCELLLLELRMAESDHQREQLMALLSEQPCPTCHGSRLRPESAAVQVKGCTLPALEAMDLEDALRTVEAWALEPREHTIAGELVVRTAERLRFLLQVGLGYLTLLRPAPSLSGGESQRVRLASQLGSELSGVTYILDEPSIGLHQRDNQHLLLALQGLRDRGNTVIVVEHDEDTIRAADWVIDFGPGAGSRGGQVLYSGPVAGLLEQKESVTADFLSGRRTIAVPKRRKVTRTSPSLQLKGITCNNLKNVDLRIPLGIMVGVSGVSGAGKSTLMHKALLPSLRAALEDSDAPCVNARQLRGIEGIDKVIEINQRPIGRTPRSNPATYSKVFDEIRRLFAEIPEAKMFGYTPSRFSFNTAGGRCEVCGGSGQIRLEMSFMADAWVPCETCRGRRFNDATLRVTHRGYSIADVLALPIDEALTLFEPQPRIRRILQTLVDVGLGYLTLGQPSTTLSGGEAQRIKLARELARKDTGGTLYVLDEPSTGLHFEDIARLMDVLQRLVDKGNTVIIIEHNLDILKSVDHLIDLGPEGGRDGGRIVAEGTPEQVARASESHTGRFLAPLLKRGRAA